MKKKLITIFSIFAAFIVSLCSIEMKIASAAEEPIMMFEVGKTYYVSYEYYENVLYPHKLESEKYYVEGSSASTKTNIFEGYNGSLSYDWKEDRLVAWDGGTKFYFDIDYNVGIGWYCSLKVNQAGTGNTNISVRYYKNDNQLGTIWKYISIDEKTSEETGEDVDLDLESNLFESISYGYTEKNNKRYLTGSDNVLTNIMSLEPTKDLLISLKYNLSNSSDVNKNVSLSQSSLIFLDENFRIIDGEYKFYQFTKVKDYKFDSSGMILDYSIILNNPIETVPNAKYFILMPSVWYFLIDGNMMFESSNYISEMYVSFVEKDSINFPNQLESLSIDYKPKDNTFIWKSELIDINSNYVSIKTSEETEFSSFLQYVNVNDSENNELSLKHGSLYPEENHIQGEKYGYILEATDKDGNSEYLLVYLYCVDKTPPVIAGSNEYRVPNSALLNVENIKKSLIVYDDVSSESEIKITTKYDYYTSNYATPGEYYVCFTATDKDGNCSDYIVKIIVEDRNKPKFYDTYNKVCTSSKVYKSVDSIFVMSDIINTISAVDEVDGKLEIKISKDNYTGNGDTPGEYLVVLSAKDKSGNVGYYNVNIIVSDKIPSKTILIDEKLIIVEKKYKLTEEDFHNIIKLIGSYNPNTTSYTTINDDIYSSSSNITGDYLVEYSIVTTSGIENEEVFTVRVIEARTSSSIKDEPEKKDGFIVSALKWLWNLILSFFEWIGSLFTK